MGKITALLSGLFRHHKLKIVYVFVFAAAFFVLCFPNEDLSDWVTAQINRSSPGVYLQMDDLHLALLPSPGVGAENVVFETRGRPAIHAGVMHLAPLISKLITFKLGVALDVEKIFGGTVALEYGQGDKAKSGASFSEISVHAERLSLDDLSGFLRAANIAGFRLQGIARADVPTLRLDPLFGDQPSGVFSLDISSFVIPAQTLMVNMNGVIVPQPLPTLDLGRLSLQGAKLADGVLDIPELQIGDSKGELHGKIKGTMGLQLRKMGEAVYPEVSAVNLNLRLVADKSFVDRNQKTVLGGFFILMPPQCKQETAKGTEINCTLKITSPGAPPSFEPPSERS